MVLTVCSMTRCRRFGAPIVDLCWPNVRDASEPLKLQAFEKWAGISVVFSSWHNDNGADDE
jgi:hypothetical protein